MSKKTVSSGQFHDSIFELTTKLKCHGQKKSVAKKEYPFGGSPKVEHLSESDAHYIQFFVDNDFYEISVGHLHGSIFTIDRNTNYIVYLAEVKKDTAPWYTAELGERFKNKRHPVLVVIDIQVVVKNYHDFYKLDGKPQDLPGITILDTFKNGYIPWYLSLTPNSILFTGLYHSPMFLGVVYCPNRYSDIFQTSFQLTDPVKLSNSNASSNFP